MPQFLGYVDDVLEVSKGDRTVACPYAQGAAADAETRPHRTPVRSFFVGQVDVVDCDPAISGVRIEFRVESVG